MQQSADRHQVARDMGTAELESNTRTAAFRLIELTGTFKNLQIRMQEMNLSDNELKGKLRQRCSHEDLFSLVIVQRAIVWLLDERYLRSIRVDAEGSEWCIFDVSDLRGQIRVDDGLIDGVSESGRWRRRLRHHSSLVAHVHRLVAVQMERIV